MTAKGNSEKSKFSHAYKLHDKRHSGSDPTCAEVMEIIDFFFFLYPAAMSLPIS